MPAGATWLQNQPFIKTDLNAFPIFSSFVTSMRKAGSIAVLALLLAHAIGFYAYFIVRLNEIHRESRLALSQLPDNQLERLQIPIASFQSNWLEEKEMEWNHRMYDIARTERSGDIVIVFARHDEDEDNLLSLLDAVFDNAREDQQQVPASVTLFFSLVYLLPSTSYFMPEVTSAQCLVPASSLPEDAKDQIVSPPPRG